MAKNIPWKKWRKYVGRLRRQNYSGVAIELSDVLQVKDFDSVILKAFLLKVAAEQLKGTPMEYEMALVALGLLKDYYGDADGIENISPAQIMTLADRRKKYLNLGPYVRQKDGARYSSYEAIETPEQRKSVENALKRRDIRLLNKKIADDIAKIENIEGYIQESKQEYIDPKKHCIKSDKIPEQTCFLEDYPAPSDLDASVVTTEPDDADLDDDSVESTPILSAPGQGDSIGGRPIYTLEEIEDGALDGLYAFNSISNSTIGDEKYFVGVRKNAEDDAGKDNAWSISEIKVEHDMEYVVRLYVHGSNKYGTDSIASNVKVAFNIPIETAKRIIITGFLFANNARPNKYWASVAFVSNTPFHLEYIYGSALIENNGIGKNGGRQLSDEIVTKAASNNGTLIGYSQLDGRVPTSYQHTSYITIRVKAVFDIPFLIKGNVRIGGSVDWTHSVKVKVGTMLEFYFRYQNISDLTQDDVMVKCTLPPNLRYIPSSTKLYNAKYEGADLSEGITTTGVNIGNYTPGSDALIHYMVEVVDDNLSDGWNTLVTWVKCCVGQIVQQESISVKVKK